MTTVLDPVDALGSALANPPDDALIVFVLDKSGSMDKLTEATVNGFNAFMEEQMRVGTTLLSLTLFDSTFTNRFVARSAEKTPKLGDVGNQYHASGATALYDAVGTSIEATDKWLVDHPTFDGRVIFVIMTDGKDNSSNVYGIARINTMISAREAEGWEFAFLGAGGAAWTEGENFSAIPAASMVSYAANTSGTIHTYAGLSNALTASRVCGTTLNDNLGHFTGKTGSGEWTLNKVTGRFEPPKGWKA